MSVRAGTSAESKKTAGKRNITHRFGGPSEVEKLFLNDDSDGVSKAGLKDEDVEGGSGSGSVERIKKEENKKEENKGAMCR
ncbi:hypothetical protein V1477_014544 [Vespula maculifrons]|uniref:Uncharacterized protein n=1 Tax=Vespula maculifrons TaxID=7453 RepID=A0ABD2BIP2_VESMC